MSALSIKRQNAQQTPYSPADPGDWSVVPQRVQAALDELAARTAGQAGLTTETLVLTSQNILTSSVSLSQVPSIPGQTVLLPVSGPVQQYGVDYEITGSVLSWLGLGLATKVEVGDTFIVSYRT